MVIEQVELVSHAIIALTSAYLFYAHAYRALNAYRALSPVLPEQLNAAPPDSAVGAAVPEQESELGELGDHTNSS